MPSGEVAHVFDETTQNTDPFHATARYPTELGVVRAVHVTPSGDVAAAVEPVATAQNTDPFQAMLSHD